ncbi:ATP F0F1 synthase subunit B [Lichenihabitans sp. PAMC28606]|uniref:F0F1 ATP synthase subunit B family protein n=1 Tax=Lichenihabitans sp. PAMC28606 TaxID=2880932 RepID=UPI001D09D882|nr:ATP F0F1 synthase subunit B [Lichenihabitans sp. PAMC28606]UDL96341.1 ATP F0F1 synthase subunit B [Lichenihabitans sp. PAMC28606]
MHFDAEFYVAIGFIVFVLGLGYLGVHKQLSAALDGRADKIRAELAEAKRLRDEADAVLQSFKRKAEQAEVEAAAIVAQARDEAAMLATETEARLVDFVARRTKQAEAKIAMAESQAAADVRAAAAEAAVAIAARVFKADPQGTGAAHLVDAEIGRLRAKLN